MTNSKKNRRFNFDENSLKGLGNETVNNSVVMACLGIGYAFLFPPISQLIHYNAPILLTVPSTLLFFIVLVYFAIKISIIGHTSNKKIPLFLGVYKRYKFLNQEVDA
jgi:hypothetical protein